LEFSGVPIFNLEVSALCRPVETAKFITLTMLWPATFRVKYRIKIAMYFFTKGFI